MNEIAREILRRELDQERQHVAWAKDQLERAKEQAEGAADLYTDALYKVQRLEEALHDE